MPFATTAELPPPAIRRLPPHAQEEITFRVAWAAVKKRCRKQDESWVPKNW